MTRILCHDNRSFFCRIYPLFLTACPLLNCQGSYYLYAIKIRIGKYENGAVRKLSAEQFEFRFRLILGFCCVTDNG